MNLQRLFATGCVVSLGLGTFLFATSPASAQNVQRSPQIRNFATTRPVVPRAPVTPFNRGFVNPNAGVNNFSNGLPTYSTYGGFNNSAYGGMPYGASPYGVQNGGMPYGVSPYGVQNGGMPYGANPYGFQNGVLPYNYGANPGMTGGYNGFSPYGYGYYGY